MIMRNNYPVKMSLAAIQALLCVAFIHLCLCVDFGFAIPETTDKNQKVPETEDPSSFQTPPIPDQSIAAEKDSNSFCDSAEEDCGTGKEKLEFNKDVEKDAEVQKSNQYFNMDKWINRVALVTGASSGIGADIAKTLVKHGVKVIGCARRVERIQAIAKEVANEKGTLIPYACDLSKPEERTKMFTYIKENYGGVDICINNAGFGSGIVLLEGDPSMWSRMLEVNVVAVAHLSQMSILNMAERGVKDGYIININSFAAHRLFPGRVPMYPASKSALRVLTEGFRRELRSINSPIRISEISPALTATEFINVSHGFSKKQTQELYSKTPHLSPSDVTNAVLYMLSTPAEVEVHDILIRATHQSD